MTDLATLGLAVDSKPVKDATTALKDFSKAGSEAQKAAKAVEDAAAKGGKSAQEFAKNFRAADAEQSNYTKGANKVIDSLANQFVRLSTNERQWAALNAVQRAGVDINSTAGQRIGNMAAALYDLEKAHKKAAEAANDNNKSTSQVSAAAQKFAQSRLQIASLLGVFGLSFATLIPLAMQLFGYISDKGGPDTERTLKEQDRLLKIVKGSFDSATGSAKNFYEQSKAVTELQLKQQELALKAQLQTQTGSAISGMTTFGNIGDFFTQTKQVKAEFAAFEDSIFRLQKSFKDGAPDVQRFQEEVAKIGLASPMLQKAAADLIAGTGDAAKTALQIEQVFASLKAFQGGSLNARQRGILGLPQDQTSEDIATAFKRQIDGISRRNAALEAEARTIGQNDAAHAKLRATLTLEDFLYSKGIKNLDAYRDRIEKAGDEAAKTADKLARNRLNDEIGFGQKTAFLSQEDVQIAERLRALYGSDVPAALASTEAAALRANAAVSQLSNVFSSGLSTALTDIAMGTEKAGEAFRKFGLTAIRALQEMIIKLTIIQPLMQSLQAGLGGSSLFSFLGGAGSPAAALAAGITPVANGGAFSGGVHPFASGGVVSNPTLFRFASGGAMNNGLMGEAGPEAIMPLKRGKDGKLGVSGGGTTIVQNNDFRGVDPSMKSWILAQIKVAQDQTLKATPGYTAKVSRDQPNLRRA